MIRKLYRFVVLSALMLALSSTAGCAEPAETRSAEKVSFSLIMKYLTRDYSDELTSGAKTAANEYGIDLAIRSLSPSDEAAMQAEIMDNALRSEADAVILIAQKTDKLRTIIDNGKKLNVPVVLIDTEWEKAGVFCSIETDRAQMAGDVIAQLRTAAKPGCTVYILNSVCPAGDTSDKKEALVYGLENNTNFLVKILDYDTTFHNDLKALLEPELSRGGGNKAVIALNGFSSVAAIQAIKESNRKIPLIAFGSSLDLVSEMENGSVNAMVVENAFTKGYMAVQCAMEAVKSGSKQDNILIKARIVTPENLYLPENQKLIFPLS